MNKRRTAKMIAGALLLAVVVAVVLSWFGGGEPRYKGSTLSYWIARSESGYLDEAQEAAFAVRHIGTNGIPFLLKWIQQGPGPESKTARFLRTLPAFVRNSRLMQRWVRGDSYPLDRNSMAILGFRLLGKDAAPAVKELDRLARDRESFGADWALRGLQVVGEPAFPALEAMAKDQSLSFRGVAVYDMGLSGDLGTNTVAAIQLLREISHETNLNAACSAVYALETFQQRPDLAVPVLLEALTNRIEPGMQRAALGALAQHGTNARAALLEVKVRLNDADADIRNLATNALERIAPEVVTNGTGHF